MDRSTRNAIIIFCVVVLVMLALAAYGYWSGAWLTEPTPSVPIPETLGRRIN